MEEFVFLKQTRLLKWNVQLPDKEEDGNGSGQIVIFVRSRFLLITPTPTTSSSSSSSSSSTNVNVGFSHPIPFAFPFNPQRLSSASLQQLALEAVVNTQQFIRPENRTALANAISAHLLNNYRFGLSDPDAPRLVIVVEVNNTRVLDLSGSGSGISGHDHEPEPDSADDPPVDEQSIVLALRNLLGVSVLSVLEPSDVSESLGLFQVPELDSFETCGGGGGDGGELAADNDDGIGTCPICLEGYSAKSARKTACSHVFHGDCIAQWVWRKTSCPLCRSKLS